VFQLQCHSTGRIRLPDYPEGTPISSGTNTVTVSGGGDTVFANNIASDIFIVVPAVPTLSEWPMIVLTGLLALAGFAALRRRTT
jgi:hypothetical protein